LPSAPENAPIIVGVGQHTVRDGAEAAIEPVDMMALVARKAEEDAETKGLLAKLDSVRVINVFSWRYSEAPSLLSERIGASPREKLYTSLGGNSPQWQVNETAEAIARGDVKLALIAGAEAVNTVRRARQRGVDLPWTPAGPKTEMVGDRRMGGNEMETKHGAIAPIQVYPLFENALRAHKGRSIEEHRARLARLCGDLSATAAQNPYAWFRDGKTGEQITTATAENRYVGFPYTKYMNAIMDVDMAAALIMTSDGEARRLGIPESRWVYILGCGDATDIWFPSDRVNFYSSPAIERCGRRAFEASGLTVDQIDYFDLYSCFPIAVEIGRDMLGVPEDDPRPLSMTGGLPYFGGPGNNYTTHGIASMVERLRAEPGTRGVVTAIGWYITKHAAGVYGAGPPDREFRRPDMSADQREIDAMPHPEVVPEPSGAATIETYTVMHNREGAPDYGIVIGRLEDERRFIANVAGDPSVLEGMTRREMVGSRGRVRHDAASGKNLFEL
jgi:acetyl-CoA C-acetyltransferase